MFRQLITRRGAFVLFLGLGISSLGIAGTASAQSSGDDTTALINRLIQDLQPHYPSPNDGLPRGGKNTREVIVIGRDGKRRVYHVDYDSSASLSVEFRLNSAELSPRSRRILKVLATVLTSSELKPYSYMLAGHTDATGSNDYNQSLSERRALAVKRHLTSKFNIKSDRLLPVGFGETQLLKPSAPNSGVNRRVEVGLIVRAPQETDPNTDTGDDTHDRQPSADGGADGGDDTNTLINN